MNVRVRRSHFSRAIFVIAVFSTGGWGPARLHADDGPSPRARLEQPFSPVPIDLGTLGGVESTSFAINNAGSVVGWSYVANGDYHAFRWSAASGMEDLGTLGGSNSIAIGISGTGNVVGYSYAAGNSTVRAFFWTAAKGMTDLGTLGGNASYAAAVNNSGVVVGLAETAEQGVMHAFIWTADSGMTDLGEGIQPLAINNNGAVVGYTSNFGTGQHAFIWTLADGLVDLGTLGGPGSQAHAINDDGVVVGISSVADEPEWHGHPFMWTAESGMVSLEPLGADPCQYSGAQAEGINSNDMIVGVSWCSHPFVWTATEGLIDIDQITDVQDVNDTGLMAGATMFGNEWHAAVWDVAPHNTSAGSDVTVMTTPTLPGGGTSDVSLIFDDVVSAGNTSVTASADGATPPAGFKTTDPTVYYDISTSATFSGSIRVCLGWIEGQVSNEANVSIFHYETGQWIDITDPASRDTVNNRVCGNAGSLSPFALFEVKYPFTGFFSPVVNQPSSNAVKAGSSIPVKFSLRGYRGLNIFASGYPGLQLVPCAAGELSADIGITSTAGQSGLSYDAQTDQYTFVWKTDKALAGKCGLLYVKLSDGEIYTARFAFR